MLKGKFYTHSFFKNSLFLPESDLFWLVVFIPKNENPNIIHFIIQFLARYFEFGEKEKQEEKSKGSKGKYGLNRIS